MVNRVKRFQHALAWREVFLTLLIVIFSAVVFYKLSGTHAPSLYTHAWDVWFQSDLPRVFESMTDRRSEEHYRVKVHPLFSLFAYPPTFLLTRFEVPQFKAVQLVITGMASLWVLAMYVLLRLAGCLRFDALLFSGLGACSAAAIFWLTVPETYAIGSVSIVAGLSLVALLDKKKLPAWVYVVVSSFTLSGTVTNWMVGILCTFHGNTWKRVLSITLIALSVVTLLWGLEKYIFPHAVFFIGDRQEAGYVFFPDIERIISVVSVFVFHTMLSPAINVMGDNNSGWPLLSVQTSLPGSAGLLSFAGSIAWVVLLGFGIWAIFTLKKLFALRMVLGLSLIGQLTLHVLYGEETFLYSLHFLPLLVTLAALATLTSLRVPAILLTAVLLPIVAANNWLQFKEANMIAVSPRDEVKNQMHLRPQDPWPRSQGHVLLAIPGSRERDRAFHETGGSFSPGVGSFGVSVWMTDSEGSLVTTSDTTAVSALSQSFVWDAEKQLPQIKTNTDLYNTEWRNVGWGGWQLDLNISDRTTLNPSLLVRSAGPAGGPIRELSWDGKSLLINKRWLLAIHPLPMAIHLGEEGSANWKGAKGKSTSVSSRSGWAFARFELGDGKRWTVNIADVNPRMVSNISPGILASDLILDLPDVRFKQSLNTQIAHMLMGIAGHETRPGAPLNYPLAKHRDGAYVLVALAKAGKLEAAKILSKDLAENDYLGEGAEDDAPGLAIWALETVANLLHQDDFDRWLWPHISRKAGIIEEMQNKHSSGGKMFFKEAIARLRSSDHALTMVEDPLNEGLNVGKLDQHRPILFVNAVSYRGLLEAARLAERLNHVNEAMRWTTAAEKIKEALEKSFKQPLSINNCAYASALWPSLVATDKRISLLNCLDNRWVNNHDAAGMYKNSPMWPYIELAEAHQWLFLGRHDRAWLAMQWFWDHQSSPGLYTWGESTGGVKSFGEWENVRGWVASPNVTLHYRTAAKMTLLQLDMLGYVDEEAAEPVVVIGGGIPTDWLSHSMTVRGLRIGSSILDWHWDGHKMKAFIRGGKHVQARLGAGFPRNTDFEFIHQD